VKYVGLMKLRLAMVGTLAGVIGGATLILAIVLSLLGGWSTWFFVVALGFVVLFHLAQWLFAPYIIDALYRVKHVDAGDSKYGWLVRMVGDLSRRSGLKKVPKVGIAEVDIPNAFAYESPLTGPRIAVTRKLLEVAPRDEIEAVLGHEIGHLKHGDVKIMMMVSLIPALLYWVGQMMVRIGFYSVILGGGRRREGGGVAIIGLLGVGLIAASFLFNIFILFLSRLREYYADSHSATVVKNGAYKLQRALARIIAFTGTLKEAGVDTSRHSHLKALFIEDPEHSYHVETYLYTRGEEWIDRLVERIKRMRVGTLSDFFSTHPHPAKRFRFLDALVTQSS